MGLGNDAHQLASMNKKRRQAYEELDGKMSTLESSINYQVLKVTSINKLQYLKVAHNNPSATYHLL